jgi:hypothetical protein
VEHDRFSCSGVVGFLCYEFALIFCLIVVASERGRASILTVVHRECCTDAGIPSQPHGTVDGCGSLRSGDGRIVPFSAYTDGGLH